MELFYVDIDNDDGSASVNYETTTDAIPKTPTMTSFLGACLDTGASKTVIGRKQATALRDGMGHRLALHTSKLRVRFGSGPSSSLGRILILITFEGEAIMVGADVVENDVPLLLGMDTFDRYRLSPDVIDNVIVHKPTGRKFQCVRKRNHLFYEWPVCGNNELAEMAKDAPNVLFTEGELKKLHKHFFHPPPRL